MCKFTGAFLETECVTTLLQILWSQMIVPSSTVAKERANREKYQCFQLTGTAEKIPWDTSFLRKLVREQSDACSEKM